MMGSVDEISIGHEGIGHVLSDNALRVPRYQRSYAWDEENVGELYSDLQEAICANTPEYFLGSVVISANTEVVDGQQRLATTSILIAAIRDYFHSSGDEKRASVIDTKYLVHEDLVTLERASRLQLNETDHDYYAKRILSLPSASRRGEAASKSSHRRLDCAAKSARQFVAGLAASTSDPTGLLARWITFLHDRARVIVFRVPDHVNAFTIFETLNDRGVALETSDLLKNFLFGTASHRIGEVETRWREMVGALETVDSDGDLVTYIRHLWSSRHGLTRERVLYRRIKSEIVSTQSAIDFATELAEGARVYAAILSPQPDTWKRYGSQTACSYMSTLNALNMTQPRPLILAILQRFAAREIKLALSMLISFAVRLNISGGLGSRLLEEQYANAARDVHGRRIKNAADLARAFKYAIPNDKQFKEAFRLAAVSKPALARYYLRVLEAYAAGQAESEFVPNPNPEAVNLEHVLPERPGMEWAHFTEEEQKTYYNRLGNLALLKKRINSKLGNEPFASKQPHYAASQFILTNEIAKASSWGVSEIEQRQDAISELAIKAWPFNPDRVRT